MQLIDHVFQIGSTTIAGLNREIVSWIVPEWSGHM